MPVAATDVRPVSPTESRALVSLKKVAKRFGPTVALDEVSFDIREGELFGYIGPNGAGKTTTIKVMVGLIREFSGSVLLDGRPVSLGAPDVLGKVGYLPQRAAFQEWRTVDQTLSTFGRLSGLTREELDERIPVVLAELGIAETRHRKIPELSGGTVQKVGLAQAILHRPEFLVLDEPMAGLDPASRFEFKSVLRGLRDQGTTVFFSSHILSDVEDLADRIAVLNLGRILHVGTFAELRSRLEVPHDVAVEIASDSGRPLDPALFASTVVSLERSGPHRLVAHLRHNADLDDGVTALVDAFRAAGYRIRAIYPIVPDLEETYVRFLARRAA